MESIDVTITNFDFEALDREIKRTMRRSARDAIQIGYMLKQMRDKKLWEIRYGCLDEYLTRELGIDYTMASRFINLNSKYSWNGNSMEIAERYRDYSPGLLIEMLSMPKELEEKVTPDMTIRQVREIKKQDKQKKDPIPEAAEVIIDGEYREVEEKKKEMVATSQSEQEPEQLEIPLLKNNDQRKEWLANYRNWGLWYRDEHIDVNYYKFDFRDGSRLVVAEYPQRHCYWKKGKGDQHYYHLLEKGRKGYGDVVYDSQFVHSTDSETYLVDFLKNLQKGDK